MKVRLSFAIGLLALLCLPAGLALADNGPHGNYTATTDACAGCHRAHTAPAARLLVDNVPNLCYTCHGTPGTGADTNVVDGIYLERDAETEAPAEGIDTRGLKGGGFTNALMDTDWDGAAASTATSSDHIADGSTGTAWGNGDIGSGPGAANFSLSCVSCHDPHGGASTVGGPTYRLLRTMPLDSGAAVGVDVSDETPKLYTVSDANNRYFGEGYAAGSWGAIDLQENQLSGWCAQCHTRHQATSGLGGVPSGDPIFSYRHLSDGVATSCTSCHEGTPCSGPAPWPNWPCLITTGGLEFKHYVECTSCHVAHGSSAAMIGYADGGPTGSGTLPGNTTATDSALLRVDNRGTCQLCHGK